jgi:hypothetical protein
MIGVASMSQDLVLLTRELATPEDGRCGSTSQIPPPRLRQAELRLLKEIHRLMDEPQSLCSLISIVPAVGTSHCQLI